MKYFTSILLVCFHYFAFGQANQYQLSQYTVEDGLPSNECHDIVQDSLGYIWIATDRGLSRFDGYGFKNYGIEDGLEDISCLRLVIDVHDNIWIYTFSKRVFRYNKESDKIEPYVYNSTIEQASRVSGFLYDFFIDSLDNKYFNINTKGILKIDTLGNAEMLNIEYDISTKFTYRIENKLFILQLGDNIAEDYFNWIHLGEKYSILFDYNRKYYTNPFGKTIDDSLNVVSLYSKVYISNKENIQKTYELKGLCDIIKLNNGNLVAGFTYGDGIQFYDNIDSLISGNVSKALLPGVAVSRLLEDDFGNLFATTLNKGFLVYNKSSISDLQNLETDNRRINRLQEGNSKLYIISDKTQLLEFNTQTGDLNTLVNDQSNLYDIHYDKASKSILCGSKLAFFACGTAQSKIKLIDIYDGIPDLAVKSIFQHDRNTYLGIHTHGFMELEDRVPIYNSYPEFSSLRVNAVAKYDDANYLLGKLDGLYLFDKVRFLKLDSIHPIFNYRINFIQKVDSLFYIATLGGGFVIWDGKDGVEVIDKSKGIISNNIENVYIDSLQNIYLCSFSGLTKIRYRKTGDFSIRNYTKQHGLLSNEVFDVARIQDTVYVATGKGISRILEEPAISIPKQPIFEVILVNNKPLIDNQNTHGFKYSENNITIQYKTIDVILKGDILYQYALNSNDWKESKATSVNYAALEPGIYTFKVRSKNHDGMVSRETSYAFTIQKPWWRTYLFYFTSLLLLVLGLILAYRIRINRLKSISKMKLDISDLERTALQAQMNPHFIFNCLNSIQSFIMQNDKDKAMDYLGTFAKLIRQNLDASTKQRISLQQELDMLKNYLELEKMRMKNGFLYDIEVDPTINALAIAFPPLLIQPFVENAIIHGMKNKEQGKGLIELKFFKSTEFLNIIIKDNGPGIQQSFTKSSSMGMSITEKRLSYINTLSRDQYVITPKSDDTGTTINIAIKLQ